MRHQSPPRNRDRIGARQNSVPRRVALQALCGAIGCHALAGKSALAASTAQTAGFFLHKDPSPKQTFAPAILVAGSKDTAAARWTRWLLPSLAKVLHTPPEDIPVTYTIGRDGVTGANKFDATTTPDGNTALMVSGATIISSLAQDPRVHFDFARWITIFAAFSPGVVVGHADIKPMRFDVLRKQPVRVAVSTPIGPELPALLGLELLHRHPIPVSGLHTASDAVAALERQAVDAIQLTGDDVANRLPGLIKQGAHILFPLSSMAGVKDFASIFNHENLHMPSARLLYRAWLILARAACLDAALNLPALASTRNIERWNEVCALTLKDKPLQRKITETGLTVVSGAQIAREVSQLKSSDARSVLALRRWIAWRSPAW